MIKISGKNYFWLTEAALALGTTTENLRQNFLKPKKINASKFGRRWIIMEDEIIKFITENQH